MTPEEKQKLLSIAKRFLRAFVAGAVSGALSVAITSQQVSSLQDLGTWLFAIAIGGFTGGLMALDKLLRYT